MIAAAWQSDLLLLAGVALALAATLVAIARDTAGRLRRSRDLLATAPGGWPVRQAA